MLDRGFLTTTAFYPSFAHNKSHLKAYEESLREVFQIIKNSLHKNTIGKLIEGPICHDGFKRLT